MVCFASEDLPFCRFLSHSESESDRFKGGRWDQEQGTIIPRLRFKCLRLFRLTIHATKIPFTHTHSLLPFHASITSQTIKRDTDLHLTRS